MSTPPPIGRPRDPEVDARIVAATKALLAEGGLDAVTIAAVARRAEVSRPAVYRRFPDREALALAVLLHDLDRVAIQQAPSVPRDLAIADQVVRLYGPVLRYYAEDPPSSAALLQLVMFRDAELDNPLNTQLFDFLQDLAARVVEAQARGELKADLDVRAFVGAVFALYMSTAIGGVRLLLDGGDAMVELFASMVELLVDGARA